MNITNYDRGHEVSPWDDLRAAAYAAAAAELLDCQPEDLLNFRFDREANQFIAIAPSGQKHRFEIDQLEAAIAKHPPGMAPLPPPPAGEGRGGGGALRCSEAPGSAFGCGKTAGVESFIPIDAPRSACNGASLCRDSASARRAALPSSGLCASSRQAWATASRCALRLPLSTVET